MFCWVCSSYKSLNGGNEHLVGVSPWAMMGIVYLAKQVFMHGPVLLMVHSSASYSRHPT